jgi:zinc transporter ZupT
MGGALLATAAALCGSLLGVYLKTGGQGARIMAPFGGGLLVGISLFGLFPELVAQIGWAGGVVFVTAGYLLLLAINRFLYPVCPSCAHDHDHGLCRATLHGFAGPLVAAAAVHSALDGWSIVTAQWAAAPGVRLALPVAVALHKIPEGIALGAILRAAVDSRGRALVWCAAAEAVTLIGGSAGLELAPRMGAEWISYPLAIAGGFFCYLGFHAVHNEWKRRGAFQALMPALTGTAGAALLQQGIRSLLG